MRHSGTGLSTGQGKARFADGNPVAARDMHWKRNSLKETHY
jgi:hypothetical protein